MVMEGIGNGGFWLVYEAERAEWRTIGVMERLDAWDGEGSGRRDHSTTDR